MSDEVDRSESIGGRIQRRVAGAVGSPLFWVVAIGLMIALPIVRTIQVQKPTPLPRLGPVHVFELNDQNGQSYGTKDLLGRIWVASMVCSECPTINPDLMEHLATIRAKTKNMVDMFRLVSFTVDPEKDTPKVMATYATNHGASSRWVFLTQSEQTHQTSETLSNVYAYDRMHQLATSAARPDALAPRLGHMVALVDRNLCVRAYYDLRNENAVLALIRGIKNVLNQPSDGQDCSATSPQAAPAPGTRSNE